MVEGKRKSRSVRRLAKVLPSGKETIQYISKKPSKAQCAECGSKLKGVPRMTNTEMQNMPKSQKRPERPFGGVLCSSCSRRKITKQFRGIFSLKNKQS